MDSLPDIGQEISPNGSLYGCPIVTFDEACPTPARRAGAYWESRRL